MQSGPTGGPRPHGGSRQRGRRRPPAPTRKQVWLPARAPTGCSRLSEDRGQAGLEGVVKFPSCARVPMCLPAGGLPPPAGAGPRYDCPSSFHLHSCVDARSCRASCRPRADRVARAKTRRPLKCVGGRSEPLQRRGWFPGGRCRPMMAGSGATPAVEAGGGHTAAAGPPPSPDSAGPPPSPDSGHAFWSATLTLTLAILGRWVPGSG